jgi:formylglycine-generating enzyme required for sulfatase activity
VEPALSQDERKARRVSLAVGACEASDGNGCFLEARFTNEGYGIPKDRVEVRKLFKKMISALTRECDANDAQSCLLLGLQYELGKHVAIDPKRAAALYKKACDGGDEGGCAGVKRLAASDEAPAFVKVPGGSFVPGCLSGCSSGAERQVAPFEMSATEISQAQFAVYVQATGAEPKGPCWTRKFLDEEFLTPRADWRFPQAGDEYPVVCVTRSDAMAYAAWLGSKTNSKVRLPSAAEFEFAARSGGQPNAYAWGNEWPPPSGAANIADLSSTLLVYHSYETQSVLTYDDGWTYGAPVGWMNPNALGLHDMTGNVYEWVSDECSARGGSWDSGNGAVLKTTGKMAVPCNGRFTAMGFRVVRDDGP